MLNEMMGAASASAGIAAAAPAYLVLGYLLITWDKRREESENAGDGQVGLKLGLLFLALLGVGLAADGLTDFLHYLASGTKVESSKLKQGIAGMIAGSVVAGGIVFLFLPRTNFREFPRSLRYATAFVAFIAGAAAVDSLNDFVVGLFTSASWAKNSGELAAIVVYGGLGFVALQRFGALSGWAAPAPRAKPQQSFPGQPQQGGGYPPQGGHQGAFPGQPQQGQPQGFPSQGQGGYGGGFPPQGGGAPPAGGGGGFPPQGGQGGGFPPQGGGAPPAGGGGFPSPGGGQGGQGGGGGLPPPTGGFPPQ